jgi:hypothetical protein
VVKDQSGPSDPGTETATGENASDADRTVTVAFRPDLIKAWLANPGQQPLLVELGDQLIASGLTVRQMHPGTKDPQLAQWFEVTAPDSAGAKRALASLRGHPAVAAAYIKPPDAPPG